MPDTNTSSLTPNNTISFTLNEETVLVLTENGFEYKGALIEDAGEAHRVFLEVVGAMKESL